MTEDIAPGYFEIVAQPMDFATVEKKLEQRQYTAKEEVCGCVCVRACVCVCVCDGVCV